MFWKPVIGRARAVTEGKQRGPSTARGKGGKDAQFHDNALS